jgi:cytochrome P450
MNVSTDTFDDVADEAPAFLPATLDRKPPYSEIDISSKAFWAQRSEERERTFKVLRETDPVSWQRPVEDAVIPDPDDPGYWAVTKHADIVRVSRENETFISGQGVLFDLLPTMVLEMSQSFLWMDPPKHDDLRRLVSAAFTPKQIQRLDDQITTAAREVVDSFAADPAGADGEIDFVARCAEKLPARLFCDMFGVPEELRAGTVKAAADLVAWADPETLAGREPDDLQIEATTTLHDIAEEIIALRRADPGDDLFSALVAAEVDGRKLDEFEIGAFFTLMSVAGTDTTKHTSSLTVRAMTHFPDQKAYLMADYDGRIKTAVDEFLRFASPVMTFRRTCVRETTLGGKTIIPGDKVVMFYPSGNMDAGVFADPETFDLARNPNPHVAFGGGGVHFCLGNQLAKSALTALFRELLTRVPDIETVGEPSWLGTNFMRGVKRMKVRFTPEK